VILGINFRCDGGPVSVRFISPRECELGIVENEVVLGYNPRMLATAAENVIRIPEDARVLWKHSDYRTGGRSKDEARARRPVVSTHAG